MKQATLKILSNITEKNFIVPLLLIGVIFAVLGFTIGINAFFIPFVKEAFNVTTTMSYLVMTATYSAFMIFGAATGPIIKKIGYKGSIVLGFLVMATGFPLIAAAAKIASFSLLLLGLFITGIGQSLMVGATHTYVAILGPIKTATSRIALMGISNKIFYAVASMILSFFMDLADVNISDTIIPFYILTGIMLVMSFLYYAAPLPDIKAVGEQQEEADKSEVPIYGNSKKSIFHFPHLLLGVLAIFFAIGVEVIALGSINDFATRLNLSSPENYVWLVSAGLVIGYSFGVFFIPKIISQRKALYIANLSGVFITLLIVIVPVGVSIYLVGLLGIANSMMIAIWPLALADLGNYTRRASSLMVSGFIGGALLPLLFGYMTDIVSFHHAYVVCLPAYFYLIYYAVSGSKLRK